MSDSVADLFKNIKIVEEDGTERTMSDEEANTMAEALEAAAEKSEEELPRMQQVVDRLNAQIPDLEIKRIGGNCPIQGEGTYQGEPLYFRSRGTHASLSVGSTDNEAPNSWNPARYASVCVTEEGDMYGAGWLTPEEVEVVIPVLIENLQERSAEENQERLNAYTEYITELANEMKKNREASGDDKDE